MKSTNKKNVHLLSPLVASLALAAGSVQAASISYLLDQSNTLPDGTSYLQVTVADGEDGAIDFTVQVLGPLTEIAGDNFGMDSFAFNVVAGSYAEAGSISGLPEGWRARNSKRMDGFGLFDIALKGRGNARLETLTFSLTDVEGDTPEDYAVLSTGSSRQGHQFFAAHVGGFESGDCYDGCDGVEPLSFRGGRAAFGPDHPNWKPNKQLPMWMRDGNPDQNYDPKDVTSGFFGGSTAVPLPATAWLFGAGMFGVLARARKRKG